MASDVMSHEQWAALAKEGKAARVPISKDVVAESPGMVAATGRLKDVTMSTPSRDRGKDTISLSGWNLANFLANPVLLWSHDYSMPPIGQVQGVEIAGDRLLAKEIVFLSEAIAPTGMAAEHVKFAAMIGAMYTAPQRFLRAFSIGMMPEEWNWDEENGGVNFLKQELLELSCCGIPMNAECLTGAKSAGIEVGLLLPYAERRLDGDASAPRWLSTRKAFEIYRTLSAPAVQVPPPPAVPKLQPEPVDVAALLRGVEERFTARLASLEQGLAARPAPPPAPTVAPTPTPVDTATLARAVAEIARERFTAITGLLPE